MHGPKNVKFVSYVLLFFLIFLYLFFLFCLSYLDFFEAQLKFEKKIWWKCPVLIFYCNCRKWPDTAATVPLTVEVRIRIAEWILYACPFWKCVWKCLSCSWEECSIRTDWNFNNTFIYSNIKAFSWSSLEGCLSHCQAKESTLDDGYLGEAICPINY